MSFWVSPLGFLPRLGLPCRFRISNKGRPRTAVLKSHLLTLALEGLTDLAKETRDFFFATGGMTTMAIGKVVTDNSWAVSGGTWTSSM